MKQLLLIALFICVLPFAAPTLADQSFDSSQQGFTNDDKSGLLLSGGAVLYGATAVTEIDGNSENGLEIVVTGTDGRLYIVQSDGTVVREIDTPITSCNSFSSTNKILGSSAVGAIRGEGTPYIVTPQGGLGDKACKGGVVSYNARTGERHGFFNLRAFSRWADFWAFSYSVKSTPALMDTTGNGKMEICFGAWDRNVYLLKPAKKNFKRGWYYNAADTVWSSCSFANIDNSPKMEIIVGTDISQNNDLNPPTPNGGYVYALNPPGEDKGAGQVNRGRFSTGKFKKFKHHSFRGELNDWYTSFNQTIFSSPVVAELIADNPGKEIVVGSGCYFPESSEDKRGKWVKILSASDGSVLQTLNASACSESEPAVGDIDNDGELEVIQAGNGAKAAGDGNSRIEAWDVTDPDPIWSTVLNDAGSTGGYGAHYQSPVVGDINGDGHMEVIISHNRSVLIFKGDTGEALTCDSNSCGDKPRLRTGGSLSSTPSLADIDGDGDLEIIQAGSRNGGGALYVWTDLVDIFPQEETTGAHAAYSTEWSTWRGNAQRNGVYE